MGRSKIVQAIKQSFDSETKKVEMETEQTTEVEIDYSQDQEHQQSLIRQRIMALKQAKTNLTAALNYAQVGKGNKQTQDNIKSSIQLIDQDIEELERQLDPRPQLIKDIKNTKDIIKKVAKMLVNDELTTESFIKLSSDICSFKSELEDMHNKLIELDKQYGQEQEKEKDITEIAKEITEQIGV